MQKQGVHRNPWNPWSKLRERLIWKSFEELWRETLGCFSWACAALLGAKITKKEHTSDETTAVLFFVTFVHLRNALRLSFQMLSSVAKRCKMVSSRVGISREKNCPANPRIQKFFNLLVALLHPIKAQSNQWQWKFNKVYLEQTVPAIPTAFFSHSCGAESVL